MRLDELQNKLKERIALGLNYGLKSVEEAIDPDSPLHNEMVGYKSQFNDLNRMASQGLLPYREVEQGLNQIRRGLIELIDRISESDTRGTKELSAPKNNELQFRKSNFFELLDLHHSNLNGITVFADAYHNGKEKQGRAAIQYIYVTYFQYDFDNEENSDIHQDPTAYSRKFFSGRYVELEVYLKTIKFILQYILDDEVEQDFFIGVMKSMLSTYEMRIMFYYGISGLDKDYAQVLRDSKLFDADFKDELIKPRHFELLG